MVILLNDIGHDKDSWPPSKGINASGGVPGMAEHDFNAAVGTEVKRLLEGKVSTYEAQGANKSGVHLNTRTRLYNAEHAKDKSAIGMSHHANANGNKSVDGFGVFYWRGSAEGKKLAQMILAEYKREFPGLPIWGTGLFESKRGDWTEFAMLRDTTAPFVLIEWDFFTNDAARKRLLSTDYRKRCAKVAAKVACDWYGVEFSEDVEQVSKPVAPKPAIKPATPAPVVKPSTVKNNSIVDYLNRQGKDSSFGARAKLAAQYGIRNYSGDADQNLQLLEKLKGGAPKVTKEYVQLPKSAQTWRTYKLNVPPQKKYSDWSLTPSAFGGLEYEVLGKPFANVVTIQTSRGKRNIYVAPSTGAKIIRK